jgi:hypothetical protein
MGSKLLISQNEIEYISLLMLEIIDHVCNPHNPNVSFLEFAVKQGLIEFFLSGV